MTFYDRLQVSFLDRNVEREAKHARITSKTNEIMPAREFEFPRE